MANKTRTEYSILNILTGLGGYAINTILGLLCRVVFTRTLAADYLGINGLFTNILTMLSLAELGIGSVIIYALYKPLAEGNDRKVAALVQFYGKCYQVIGCVVAVIGLCLMPFLNILIKDQPDIKESLYLIYALYLFNTASTYFFSYRSSLISAAQQNYIVTGLNYIITIIQSLIQTIWLFATHEYLGYLVITTIGTFIYNITISYIAKKKYPYITDKKNIEPITKTEKKELVRNVRAMTIWKLSGLLVNSTDNIIITYFNGLIAVGMASNYTLLSGTLTSLLNQIFNSITASIGNLNAIESKERRISIFNNLNLANFWLFGWASIGIFVVSSDIVALLFGANYVLDFKISLIIALNFYMVGIQNTVWSYNNSMGLFRQGRYLLLLTAAINLTVSIILGKFLGLFGIFAATAISRLFTNTWYDPYKLFKHGFKDRVWPYYIKRITRFLLLIATATLCYYLSLLVDVSLFVNLIYKFIICCIIPNFVFWLLFHKTTEFSYFKDLLKSIFSKIKNMVTNKVKRHQVQ